MLHFVTFYMNQNKSRKQTLESAQYGLEISFKFFHMVFYNKSMIIKRIKSQRKSNSEIFIPIYRLSNFPAKKPHYFTSLSISKN